MIEVLIAALIMGITIAAVSEVIRTGMRAWRAGHGASELEQSVRITQDVVLRDFDNLFYKNETDYNVGFRAQLQTIAQGFGTQVAQNAANMGKVQQMIGQALSGKKRSSRSLIKNNDANDMSLEDVSPPLNLTFHGSDTLLSFARTYRARFSGDQDTWGIRRVTYFVRNKVLYRKEEDPFGLRISQMYNSTAPAEANNPVLVIREQLERLFAVPDQAELKEGEPQAAAAAALLPTQVRIEEPLCAGVETFKIKYSYFADGKWQEDTKWDSQGHEHRTPPQPDNGQPNTPMAAVNAGGGGGISTPFMPGMVAGQRGPGMPGLAVGPLGQIYIPDDLPGSITVQIGVRMPDGKGKIFNFTVLHSLPEAKETDVLLEDANGRPLR